MSCRGVLIALTVEDERKLLSLASPAERLAFLDEIAYDPAHSCDMEKTWDAMHRCFDAGELSFSAATPERMAVLGGRLLCDEGGWIITYKTAEEVQNVNLALAAVTRRALLERYFALKDTDYDFPDYSIVTDAKDTCRSFEDVRRFYQRAAASGRSVIFTVDL